MPPPRSRRQSHRDLRTRVYVEGPNGGITEKSSNTGTHGEREVWVQVGDAADSATREAYADALLALHATPKESLDVGVAGDQHQPYVDYQPGDTVAAEDRDGMRTARAEAITMRLGDQVDSDVTLLSRSRLRLQELESLQATMSDGRMAANPDLQRRHGLVSADRILTGTLQVGTDILSGDFTAGSDGFRIRGDGTAEFNDVVIRGTAESSNYAAGSDGWHIDDDGSAEFNNVIVRGEVHASSGDISGDLTVGGSLQADFTAGSSGWKINGDGTAEFNEITVRGTIDTSTIAGPVNVTGSIKSDNYSAGSAGWKIDGTGSAEFNDVTVRGIVDATDSNGDGIKVKNNEVGFYSGGTRQARLEYDTTNNTSVWIADGAPNANIQVLDGRLRLTDGHGDAVIDVGTTQVGVTGNLHGDGWIASGTSTTSGRPTADSGNVGAMWYDTDDSRPIWSDGSDWRYADGTLA